MQCLSRQRGFSLTETLLAVGTLAVGLLFIAGTFMTGIFLATVSTERTIAAVAADEAFAKIQVFGLDLDAPDLKSTGFMPYEPNAPVGYLYPSTVDTSGSQYCWVALCRRVSPTSRLVQIVVFVSRKAGTNVRYWVRQPDPNDLTLSPSDLPRPVRVKVEPSGAATAADELRIVDAVGSDATDESEFVNDGSVLVADQTGHIYRVLERYAAQPDVVKLDRLWEEDPPASGADQWVWVIPPPISGGRNPFIAVYQRMLRF
jgi:Tfp pilus assembly protein PilW